MTCRSYWLLRIICVSYYKPRNSVQTNENYLIEIVKVKLATVVEGDQKAPFSIATTLRRSGGRYFFP